INTADSQGPNPTNPTAAPLGVRQVTSANASGNPYLNPWRSNNYDISLEYYLGRASMLNIGLFKLNIDSFVTTATQM
ncbi:TonB-dependent receptor domain-containing protein, partial [Serratia marcescens]|uniref:TonB-dependent receptor domain-containing protein n=9 Tax=Pseudomonadota TaxID=1224 RepID=UPI0013DBDB42